LRERAREHKQGERQREERQTPHREWSPTRDPIPGPGDHDPNQSQIPNQLSHPGILPLVVSIYPSPKSKLILVQLQNYWGSPHCWPDLIAQTVLSAFRAFSFLIYVLYTWKTNFSQEEIFFHVTLFLPNSKALSFKAFHDVTPSHSSHVLTRQTFSLNEINILTTHPKCPVCLC